RPSRPGAAAFPYPTRFRSHAWLGEAIGVEGDQVELPARRALLDAVSRFSFAISAYARALSIGIDETTDEAFEQFKRALAPIDPIDRKSTRLNSSHVKISYA